MLRRTAIINIPCSDAHRSSKGCCKTNCLMRHDLENIKKVTYPCEAKGCKFRVDFPMISSSYMQRCVYYCRDCVKDNKHSIETSPYRPIMVSGTELKYGVKI